MVEHMFDMEQMEQMEQMEPEIRPEDLVDEIDALASKITREEARLVSMMQDVIATEAHKRNGYSSPTAMLKHRQSLHPGDAQRLVSRANGLLSAPLTAMAYQTGAITGAQVDVLLEASYLAPDPFTAQEGDLVEIAMDTPLVRDLRKRLDYWIQEVAPDDQAADHDLFHDMRGVRIRRVDGLIKASISLDEEAGEQLLSALEPGPPAEEDSRTLPQRRADQLMDVLNGGTEKPNITVHVSAEALTDPGPTISESSYGTYMSALSIERLSCDAEITRVVLGPVSQPIDVGRTKRLVTPAMRIALAARDLGCVFPGCDRPSTWCDAHHIVHWSKGGGTSLGNLVLLCRHHHMLVHEVGWTIGGTGGDAEFFRPDGTPLSEKPTPPRVDRSPPNRQDRTPLFMLLKDIPRFPRGP